MKIRRVAERLRLACDLLAARRLQRRERERGQGVRSSAAEKSKAMRRSADDRLMRSQALDRGSNEFVAVVREILLR